MREMLEHKAYKYIDRLKQNGSCGFKYIHIDYVILENDVLYNDLNMHKQVAIESMKILESRQRAKLQKFNPKLNLRVNYKINQNKMVAIKVPIENFFDEKSEYARAFLEPVYANKKLTLDTFKTLNNILFPNKECLEIYNWCNGVDWNYNPAPIWKNKWSNYFDDGLEWWGIYFWSIYDKVLNTFTTISASTTD